MVFPSWLTQSEYFPVLEFKVTHGFLQPWVLKLAVLTTTGVTLTGS